MQTQAKSKNLADLKAYLERERARLVLQIGASDLSVGDERTGYSNHMAEDATIVFEQARNVGQRRNHELMLADVEDALRRIEDGTYGYCRRCGAEIDTARLMALPTAALCYDCQEHLEAR